MVTLNFFLISYFLTFGVIKWTLLKKVLQFYLFTMIYVRFDILMYILEVS